MHLTRIITLITLLTTPPSLFLQIPLSIPSTGWRKYQLRIRRRTDYSSRHIAPSLASGEVTPIQFLFSLVTLGVIDVAFGAGLGFAVSAARAIAVATGAMTITIILDSDYIDGGGTDLGMIINRAKEQWLKHGSRPGASGTLSPNARLRSMLRDPRKFAPVERPIRTRSRTCASLKTPVWLGTDRLFLVSR